MNVIHSFVLASIVTALPLRRTHHSQTPALACQQATSGSARTAHFDPNIDISGAGRFEPVGGGTQIVWTGRDCVAWITARGRVQPMADERGVLTETGGEFIAVDRRDSLSREYHVTPSGARLVVNGREADVSAGDREWLAGMIREYVRRAGIGADERAEQLIAKGGTAALLVEAAQIRVQSVRLSYLRVAFPHLTAANQVQYVRDAAELLDNSYRTTFLMAVPRKWRSAPQMIETVYAAAASLEPDSDVIAIMEAFPPPPSAQMSATMREQLDRMIASLQSSDTRREWRARYLGSR